MGSLGETCISGLNLQTGDCLECGSVGWKLGPNSEERRQVRPFHISRPDRSEGDSGLSPR